MHFDDEADQMEIGTIEGFQFIETEATDEPCQPGRDDGRPDEMKRIGNNKKPYRKHAVRSKAKAARQARKAARRK